MTSRTYGNTADYAGREFDLLAVQGAKAVGDILLDQTMFSDADAGEVCTGVQKLAQRWMLHFLTERGSMTFNQEDGTDFMTQARFSQWHVEEDVIEAFEFAAADVALYMANEENDDMHPEDRFAAAELLELTLLPQNSLSLKIQITSQAGTSRQVILPVSFTPITTG